MTCPNSFDNICVAIYELKTYDNRVCKHNNLSLITIWFYMDLKDNKLMLKVLNMFTS